MEPTSLLKLPNTKLSFPNGLHALFTGVPIIIWELIPRMRLGLSRTLVKANASVNNFLSFLFVQCLHLERDGGIICVKIYDDLTLEAWTQ